MSLKKPTQTSISIIGSVIGTNYNRTYTYTSDDFGRVTKQAITQSGKSNEYQEEQKVMKL